jgi:hypothetical protein
MDSNTGQRHVAETRGLPLAPTEKEKTMQCIYRCTRCGTGRLAKMIEPSGQGWAVHVFICNRCRYASQPGEPLAAPQGEGAVEVSLR